MNRLIFLILFFFFFSAMAQEELENPKDQTKKENLSEEDLIAKEKEEALEKDRTESLSSTFQGQEEVQSGLSLSSERGLAKTKKKGKKSPYANVSCAEIKKKKPGRRLRLSEVAPGNSLKSFYPAGSDEAELERVTNQGIRHLYSLLRKKRSADLTLRLGSLYADKAKLISQKLEEDYNAKLQAFKSGQRKLKPVLNLKSAKVYNRKSLKLFEDFQAFYPKNSRMDEVLFFLGFNFYELNNEKKGIKYFALLEKCYPKSAYIYEAKFKLGEHHFQDNDWPQSYKYYTQVARSKRGKFYFFALYKLAWSSYKMGKIDRGLQYLSRIIKEGRKFKVRSDRNQVVTFDDEAIEDLVLFYTYSKKKPSQAKTFFLSLLEEDMAWERMEKLARAYKETSQPRSAMAIYQALIDKDPRGKKAFQYKQEVVEITYSVGKNSEILKQIGEWLADYGPGSPWVNANKLNPLLTSKTLKAQELLLRDYTKRKHSAFESSKRASARNLAFQLYKLYFQTFKKSAHLAEMHYFYAELLFDSGKYVAAVKSYEEVVGNYPNSKYAKAAYMNQVVAFEKALPKDKEIKQVIGKSEKPVAFPKTISSFFKVGKRYIQKFPKAKNASSLLYKMAALHYTFNQFPEASRLFQQFLDSYPKAKESPQVAALLLEIYGKTKNYKALENLARTLAKRKNVNPETLKEVRFVLEQLSFKKAQDLAVKKKFKESALLFQKFAKENPSSALAPTAYYNAALNFEKGKNAFAAIPVYQAVLAYKKNLDPKIKKNSQKNLALIYEKLGYYNKAAYAYMDYAASFPKDPESLDFIFNSAVIFDALGKEALAIKNYNQYFSLSKKQERHEVFFLMAYMYHKKGKWSKAIAQYKRYLSSNSSNKLRLVKASFQVADIYANKLKNSTQAKAWHQKTISLHKRLRSGSAFAARSQFYLVSPGYQDFLKVKIPASEAKQAQAVKRKQNLIKKLERSLKPVIRYKEPESEIASLVLIGDANKEMARSIYQAPLPRRLDKKGRAQYKLGIKKIVQPYVSQAIKHYDLALKKSASFEVYSEDIKKAYLGKKSFKMKGEQFEDFRESSSFQEVESLSLLDDSGTVVGGLLGSVAKSLKYGVSKKDFEALSGAIKKGREAEVLKVASRILNKDSKNLVAINSLAYFYFKKNQWDVGSLILNRLPKAEKNKSAVIQNNLAVLHKRYGFPREAVSYLKKALKIKSRYPIARINLASLFINQYDYKNASKYFEGSQQQVRKKWSGQDKKSLDLLNAYGVSLTGVKQWKKAQFVFKNLSSSRSPKPDYLFNYALFLQEKSHYEKGAQARKSLSKAKSLLDELSSQSGRLSASLRRKTGLLLKNISDTLKKRETAGVKKKKKRGGKSK